MRYTQLDFRKRCQIYGFLSAGHNFSKIAKEIGVHRSTISRELKRNLTFVYTSLGCWQYKPNYAQTYADERHKAKSKHRKFTQIVEEFVRAKLLEDWSPEQISGYANHHQLFSISTERIYQYVLKDKEQGGTLYLHLRHQHKRYRKRYGSPNRQGPIKNRTFIDERPKVVDEKSRIGDWEIDTIIGKNRKEAIITALSPYVNSVLTITGDNGVEFAEHEAIKKALNTEFYFAHPYSSWERGLNENTNGLIRQYLHKGSSFSHITDNDLTTILDKLNNRPRKGLNYSTPNEIFEQGTRLFSCNSI